ncbi:alternative ribosome rescue aminoacyl-tRNA hydrolase ArfB [Acetobacter peroxydans]|jgi:ribosome-associated protein|uniref:alternative ribosome rescue aminoacyl-tRNA hydrolase ArfB n=1 Tax=Acetobacter peroxydans TaxID=104098 RepID=UPI0023522385|nr:alternative ribosome rescue aminoacyl-tRNA hydrolase ArfB [Acetobacter peroxydans]MCH4094417.1 aminoacyl-tRNA hydrolase [Acetobacter peroxydans]MCH4144294.1 aminoacyl-tRNA hydrolase [Acetobacter peroxydans]MCI1395558.1 aminoacyl-tRNA hydrolase [Acetobacter peroxydans]MCI1412350.1 aminoacyl-tRNA hydrolase [Acetobacter peroxydans]MCI1440447.1 aminoacyl-tRNA hydrolase [Acetobacter peroxydans]
MTIPISPGLFLAESELEFSYILASGPGGQNVNKVATAAQLRFDAARSPSLTDRVRTRLLELAGSRATRDGVIVITARRFRTQQRNREDAVERLAALLREATHRQAFRVATRPSRAARQRRLDGKSHRAAIKRGRSASYDD